MRWTALNSVGALFWLVGLYLALGLSRGGPFDAWLPAHPLPLGAALSLVGLATLVWANVSDA